MDLKGRFDGFQQKTYPTTYLLKGSPYNQYKKGISCHSLRFLKRSMRKWETIPIAVNTAELQMMMMCHSIILMCSLLSKQPQGYALQSLSLKKQLTIPS